eukprot:s1300_g16.t1
MEKPKRIEKSKDGVPIWDGDSATFQEYEEASLLWEQGIASHKRYLCAARLVTELVGTAKRHVLGKRPDWVSFNGGVEKLMTHLRQRLGLPQIPELTDYLTRFFKQGKRRRGETMNEYITRKTETYTRAQQALGRVLTAYGENSMRWSGSMARSSTRANTWRDDATVTASGASQQGNQEEEFQEAEETESNFDPWAQASSQNRHDWWSQGWQQPWWDRDWYDHGDDQADWTREVPEILPDMIQGWYLLSDAGLDTGERNMILASIKQDFSFDRVAQELRNQWSDEDLRRRDQAGRHSSWWMDDDDQQSDELDDLAMTATEDLNEEGQALMAAAQADAEMALAAVQNGRRTLREARERQQQVRLSRKYFKTTTKYNYKGDGKGKSSGTSSTCLRCGGDHKTANCPRTSNVAATASGTDQNAPFVCFADAGEIEYVMGNFTDAPAEEQVCAAVPPSTPEVVEQGKAVLDGGATRTIGSVHALEKLMALNQQQNGSTGLHHLNTEDRPTFGFGNSTRNQCVSTAAFQIKADGRPGQLQIHALDHGDGPVLFSIASLRALGAVVDFSEDLVVFRKLNDRKLIQLERSSTGHQLLPLTTDWYDGAAEASTAIPSLRSFI